MKLAPNLRSSVPLALLLALVALPFRAQEGITGVITGEGYSRIKIGVPGGAGGGVETELVETLRDDLAFSGFFDVIEPSLYRLVPAAPAEGPPRYPDWLSIGADALIETRLTLPGDRIDLTARLYDNQSGRLVFHKRYAGTQELRRRVAHQLADEIVQHYTGKPGIASTRIAFASKHGEGKEIYLMDYDGMRVRRITTSETINLSPKWSPAGEELAYVSWRSRRPSIYAMSDQGSLARLDVLSAELTSAPGWSPDGSQLVYSSTYDKNSEIYILDRTRGKNQRLTHLAAIDTSPAFSPNGREIAFTSDRGGTPQIYIMDTDGVNVRRVSSEGNYNDSAAWSPRGDLLAYASRIDGRFEIAVLHLASGRATRLTRGEGNNENPSWSSDGRHLVFSSSRTGTYQIHTMRADGTNVRQLTRGAACYTPDWSR